MTKKRKTTLTLFTALSLVSAGQALAQPADWRAKADAYLQTAFPADGPGGAVIIMDDGKIVYAGGRGLADIEAKTPITPDTVFRLGSITKQFSAAVMMQLVDEGKVSLDDPLSKFLPDYPGDAANATVRQLLNHTVGVQSYTGIPGGMEEQVTSRAYSTQEMVALFKDLPAPSKPGEKFAYNNSGYVLLGAVIEAITGKSWYEAIDERIARPLGLSTIRYGAGEATFDRMAKGYTSGGNGQKPSQKVHMSFPHAAGALVGSVADLAKWGQALHHGKVVSPQSYAGMTGSVKTADGETTPYGFGLMQEKLRGRDGIAHSGGIFGFSTDSIYLPKEDMFVAVFANSDDPATSPSTAMHRLAALALGDPYPTFAKVEANVDSLEPMFGLYALKEGEGERRFFAREGQLYTQRSGASESKVYAAGDNRFFYGPESLNWFEIKREGVGAPVMEMHQNGADEFDAAVRSGPIPPEPKLVEVPRATLARYVGSYTARMGIAAIALGDDGKLTVKLGGQPAAPLMPIGATEFRVQGVDAGVVFHLENDVVTRLVIHQGGREIPAERVKG